MPPCPDWRLVTSEVVQRTGKRTYGGSELQQGEMRDAARFTPADTGGLPSETLLLRAALLRSEEGLKSYQEKWQMELSAAPNPPRPGLPLICQPKGFGSAGTLAETTRQVSPGPPPISCVSMMPLSCPPAPKRSRTGFLLSSGAALVWSHYSVPAIGPWWTLTSLVREERADKRRSAWRVRLPPRSATPRSRPRPLGPAHG